jgi:TolB-like protein/DNA-binding winged helix-turn-helix (wHTH) protein
VEFVFASRVSGEIVLFEDFEANLRSRELHRQGSKVRLPDQSFQVLALLLAHPGELVAREDIRNKLWPGDTFVDFDHGLNNAVNRLREALGDYADSPRLIETLPRRGYRFIGIVKEFTRQESPPAVDSGVAATPPSQPQLSGNRWTKRIRYGRITVVVQVLLILLLVGLNFGNLRQRLFPNAIPSQPIRSIAVLPFENLSGDPSQDYFADGVTDALITRMAQISSLRVISRTSTMHYKGSRQALPEIAREMGVDAVVEGGIVRSGNRVRITAQLLAASDRHLWAKAYDRDAREILSVQQDVAQNIVREIQAKLTPVEEARLLVTSPDVNPEAYSSYLLGESYLRKRSLDGYNKGLALFQRAIEADPTYAPGYSGLADCYNLLGLGMGQFSAIEAANRARAAARKALELDQSLAEAHAALAFTLLRYDWNWAEAQKEKTRANEIEHAVKGADAQPTQDIDPLSVQGVRHISATYIAAEQYDKATAYYRKAIELQPDSFRLRMDLATGYSSAGRYEEAVEEFQKVIALYGPNVFSEAELGYAYARGGRTSEAEKIINDLKKTGKPGYSSYAIAKICVALERKEQTLDWLQRAYRERAAQMSGLHADSAFASIRSDSRFQDLVRRVGIPTNSN